MISIKTPEAIEILKEGGVLLARMLNELEAVAIAGNTTLDIDDVAMELINMYQVEPMILGYHAPFASRPYPAATCVSINDEVVHGIPNESPKTIQQGDLVSIDLVIGYKGLVLDSARTIGVGMVSNEARDLLTITKTALQAGVQAAIVGHEVYDIGRAIAKVVPKKYGIIKTFCGHGVGYSLHEEPTIPNYAERGSSPRLEAGMVLAIEPMITTGGIEVEVLDDGYTAVTVDGSLSAHMEHTVLITEEGPKVLTLE